MYGESYVTYCGYEDYVMDLDKFPELKEKSREEIAKWVYDNAGELSVNYSYEDKKPREGQGNAYEIVPYDENSSLLLDGLGSDGCNWDKIKHEEHYMLFIREEKDEEDEVTL
jgi:hypothetical protein